MPTRQTFIDLAEGTIALVAHALLLCVLGAIGLVLVVLAPFTWAVSRAMRQVERDCGPRA